MKIVAGSEIRRRLQASPPLVEELIDPDTQIQMNGIDFTLREVLNFKNEAGAIALDNQRRRIPPTEPIAPDEQGWWKLKRGIYWVIFNEIVNIPADVFAIARPRSSLLRSGSTVETALWDSGYSGRSGSLLVVHHPAGLLLEKNARLIQMVFFCLEREAERTYAGRYQRENLEEQLGLFRREKV